MEKLRFLKKDDIKFFYRGSNLDRKLIILNVTFQGEQGKKVKFKIYKKFF